MKSLLSRHILAPTENMCFLSLGTVQKAALLLFSFTVICFMCTQKHKICSYRHTNYLMSNSKHLKSDCLRGSDQCWSPLTPTWLLGTALLVMQTWSPSSSQEWLQWRCPWVASLSHCELHYGTEDVGTRVLCSLASHACFWLLCRACISCSPPQPLLQ